MKTTPTREQMDYCLKVFHLTPKPLAQAAESFLDTFAKWVTETHQFVPNELNDAYSILRQALTPPPAHDVMGEFRKTQDGRDFIASLPRAGVDYDPDAPMCQDDYEYFSRTGEYAKTK